MGRRRGPKSLSTRLLIAACLGAIVAACSRNNDDVRAAAVARSWLELMDAGQYGQAWTAAAPYLQRAVSAEQWSESMSRNRAPLGKMQSREIRSSKATTCALNNPCIVIEYTASFEKEPGAIETTTLIPNADGQWKVAGYYIK